MASVCVEYAITTSTTARRDIPIWDDSLGLFDLFDLFELFEWLVCGMNYHVCFKRVSSNKINST